MHVTEAHRLLQRSIIRIESNSIELDDDDAVWNNPANAANDDELDAAADAAIADAENNVQGDNNNGGNENGNEMSTDADGAEPAKKKKKDEGAKPAASK